jgi:prolyl-tRNA synthetase
LREPKEGDRCPNCGGALSFQTAIEVGHIFNFGDKYSSSLDATFLDEDGKEKPLIGGSYGIGPGRIIAAVIEQNHDLHGIAGWPRSIAPYHADLIGIPVRVTVGKKTLEDGAVDVRDRATGEEQRVPAEEVTI